MKKLFIAALTAIGLSAIGATVPINRISDIPDATQLRPSVILNGQVPAWNLTLRRWEPSTPGAGTNASRIFFNGTALDAPDFDNGTGYTWGVVDTNVTLTLSAGLQALSPLGTAVTNGLESIAGAAATYQKLTNSYAATNTIIYLAPRTDGNPGSGTADNPFDASTAVKLDAVLFAHLGSVGSGNVTFKLAPGTYYSAGQGDYGATYGWYANSNSVNVQINGAGSANTKIVLTNAAAQTGTYAAAVFDFHCRNVEVSGITFDLGGVNVAGAGRTLAVYFAGGTNIVMRDLVATHALGGATPVNTFTVINNSDGTKGQNVLIENVRMHSTLSGVHNGIASAADYTRVANCFIDLAGGGVGSIGIGLGGNGSSYYGNTVTNSSDGMSTDTGNFSDFSIHDNYLHGTSSGINIIPATGQSVSNVLIYGNTLRGGDYGIVLQRTGSGVVRDVAILNNQFPVISSTYGIALSYVTNAVVRNNILAAGNTINAANGANESFWNQYYDGSLVTSSVSNSIVAGTIETMQGRLYPIAAGANITISTNAGVLSIAGAAGGATSDPLVLGIIQVRTNYMDYAVVSNSMDVATGNFGTAIFTNAVERLNFMSGAGDSAIITNSFTNLVLTATRVPFAGAGKQLTDDADLTFATDTLNATKITAPTSIYTGQANNGVTYTGDATATNTVRIVGSATPTTSAAGVMGFDTDALAASRGAVQINDGTSNHFMVAIPVSGWTDASDGNLLAINKTGGYYYPVAPQAPGSGDDVWVNGTDISNPNLQTNTSIAIEYNGTNINFRVANAAILTNITTSGTFAVPQSDDPDVAAAGQISWDTDGWMRAYDGANQVAIARKIEEIHATIIAPNDLADSVRDACLIWSNESGMSFIITGWKGWSGTDNTTLNIETTAADGSSNATVDAVEIATDGTGVFTGADTTITAATIANGSLIWLDFDDTDTPTYVKITIYGYYDANVN